MPLLTSISQLVPLLTTILGYDGEPVFVVLFVVAIVVVSCCDFEARKSL